MFFLESGLVPTDASGLASFFRSTPGLNKKMVGEYLGEKDTFNQSVLKEFCRGNLLLLIITE